jgi:hypothetical protein
MDNSYKRYTNDDGRCRDLNIDQIYGASLENIERLAKWLGIDVSKYEGTPEAKWRIACAIVRHNKKNPQTKCNNK